MYLCEDNESQPVSLARGDAYRTTVNMDPAGPVDCRRDEGRGYEVVSVHSAAQPKHDPFMAAVRSAKTPQSNPGELGDMGGNDEMTPSPVYATDGILSFSTRAVRIRSDPGARSEALPPVAHQAIQPGLCLRWRSMTAIIWLIVCACTPSITVSHEPIPSFRAVLLHIACTRFG